MNAEAGMRGAVAGTMTEAVVEETEGGDADAGGAGAGARMAEAAEERGADA